MTYIRAGTLGASVVGKSVGVPGGHGTLYACLYGSVVEELIGVPDGTLDVAVVGELIGVPGGSLDVAVVGELIDVPDGTSDVAVVGELIGVPGGILGASGGTVIGVL